MLEQAISEKTKCIFLAHTLGNPFDLDAIMRVAKKHNLWLIEDNCDALGSRYDGKLTGTFGDISTMSFYPAHHITTGEGGAVATNDESLAQIIRSFRDWGRDCYCAGGENNTCGKRFSQSFGTLPRGYDHKYVYSELGYNLKMTEMQSAIGSAQIDKLPKFCERRKENFASLAAIFNNYSEYFILPEATKRSDPAWFTYILTVRDTAPFTRNDLVQFLNDRKIETRNFFAGNIIRQPAYLNTVYRVADNLRNTDMIMNNTFFLGTYPGLSNPMIQYIGDMVHEFIRKH
jgi:CDP-6-deoxy-D-xylo-4-hexulose-3-dehydrase